MRRVGGVTEKYAWKRQQAGFLYAERLKRGWTIRAAAKHCNVHWTTFEKAENGFPISNKTARKIADGIGITEEQALRLVMGFRQRPAEAEKE